MLFDYLTKGEGTFPQGIGSLRLVKGESTPRYSGEDLASGFYLYGRPTARTPPREILRGLLAERGAPIRANRELAVLKTLFTSAWRGGCTRATILSARSRTRHLWRCANYVIFNAGWRSSMAEQWFCKPQVGGSIPLASSTT